MNFTDEDYPCTDARGVLYSAELYTCKWSSVLKPIRYITMWLNETTALSRRNISIKKWARDKQLSIRMKVGKNVSG